jgi:hypothetical protein
LIALLSWIVRAKERTVNTIVRVFFTSDSSLEKISLEMPKTRSNAAIEENRTASDSKGDPRPIRGSESDAGFVTRLEEISGKNKSEFSRRCGFKESVLRGYLIDGKKPGLDYLVAIANAAMVNIEWLATGKGPKTRAEQRAAQTQMQYQVGGGAPALPRIEYPLLRECLGACNIVYGEPFSFATAALQMEYAVDLYNALLPNIGARVSFQDLAARDARSLADALRGLIAIGAARPWRP